MIIDEEIFNDWLQHPVTEAYMQLLKDEVMARRELVGGGVCLMDRTRFEDIGQHYSTQMEIIKAYETILNGLTYENLFPTDEESEIDGSENQEDVG